MSNKKGSSLIKNEHCDNQGRDSFGLTFQTFLLHDHLNSAKGKAVLMDTAKDKHAMQDKAKKYSNGNSRIKLMWHEKFPSDFFQPMKRKEEELPHKEKNDKQSKTVRKRPSSVVIMKRVTNNFMPGNNPEVVENSNILPRTLRGAEEILNRETPKFAFFGRTKSFDMSPKAVNSPKPPAKPKIANETETNISNAHVDESGDGKYNENKMTIKNLLDFKVETRKSQSHSQQNIFRISTHRIFRPKEENSGYSVCSARLDEPEMNEPPEAKSGGRRLSLKKYILKQCTKTTRDNANLVAVKPYNSLNKNIHLRKNSFSEIDSNPTAWGDLSISESKSVLNNVAPGKSKLKSKIIFQDEKGAFEKMEDILRKSTINLKGSLYEKIKKNNFLNKEDNQEPKKRILRVSFFRNLSNRNVELE